MASADSPPWSGEYHVTLYPVDRRLQARRRKDGLFAPPESPTVQTLFGNHCLLDCGALGRIDTRSLAMDGACGFRHGRHSWSFRMLATAAK